MGRTPHKLLTRFAQSSLAETIGPDSPGLSDVSGQSLDMILVALVPGLCRIL